MRISDAGTAQAGLRRLQLHMSAVERARTELGTGKRIRRPSDDVAGFSRAQALRQTAGASSQAQRNVEDGIMWSRLADTVLQDVVSRLHRAKELSVAGANSTTSHDALADEVAALRADILDLANTRHLGRSLFGGHSSGDAVVDGGGTWSYAGDAGVVSRRIGESTTVQVNVTADDVFGFTAGRSVFESLDDLEARLRAGDTAGVSASIDDVDTALDQVLGSLATVGGVGERLEAARVRLDDDLMTVRENLSSIEDADLANSVVTLQMQQAAYEAALAALRSIDMSSLTNFIG